MPLFFTKIVSILLSCIFLLHAYLFKSHVKTWVFPACIFSLFLFAYTFIPLVIVYKAPVSPFAILYILIYSIIFSSSSLQFDWKRAYRANVAKLNLGGAQVFNMPFLRMVFIICQLWALFTIVINIHLNGVMLSDYVNDFYGTSSLYVSRRYSGYIVINLFFQSGLVLNYLGVALGGLMIGCCKKRVIYFILSFLPSVFSLLLYGDKGGIFFGISLFYGGVLISRIFDNDFSLTTPTTNKTLLIAICILFPLITISFVVRGLFHLSSSDLLRSLAGQYFSYALGHIYAFADWFSYYFFSDSHKVYGGITDSWGLYTFGIIFKVLGFDANLPAGLYSEYFQYSNLTTNIYTIFRGLILDYGFFGSLIFAYISGFFFNFSFYFMLRTKRPVVSVAIFILMIGFFYLSYVASALKYGSVYAWLVLLVLVIFFNKIKLRFSMISNN